MQSLRFEMDFGTDFTVVDPPRNWKDMKVQLIFDGAEIQAQLQSIVFEWVNSNYTKIKNYLNSGLGGGTGIYEGIGLKIYAGAGVAPVVIFDGCLDTANRGYKEETGIIKCPIRDGRTDWLNDVAQSFTFEYLTSLTAGSPGRITRADYKQTPYCISTIPNYTQAMMLSISLFLIVKESIDVICKIESLIARMIGEGMSWFQLIMTIIEVILYLIYLYLLIKASLKLMQDLMDNIIQPKKWKLCMREADLWTKACDHLGLQFSSTIYGINATLGYNGRYKNATWMPKKIVKPQGDSFFEIYHRPPDESTNPESYGYFEGTFKAYIDEMCKRYNARAIIKGNTLYFEEKHHWNLFNAYRMPNEGEVGYTFNYQDPHTTNADEIPVVYALSFQKDDQEINTYNDYTGTYAIAQMTPNVIHNKRNLLLNNAVEIQLGSALARRKMSMSKIERNLLEIIEGFNHWTQQVIDITDEVNNWIAGNAPGGVNDALGQIPASTLVGFFTGQPLFAVGSMVFGSSGFPIFTAQNLTFDTDRVGWLLLSNDFIGIPKTFLGVQDGDDWKLDPANQDTTVITSIDMTTLNGTFVATGFGGVYGPFYGTVVNGFVSGSIACSPPSGFVSGVITGTITGLTGIFSISVHGFAGAGHLTFSGFLTPLTGSSTSVGGNCSALALMTDFHSLNFIDKDQWLVYDNKKIRFSEKDFVQVSNNNVFLLPDGQRAKFTRVLWDMHNDTAEVDFRINKKFTNNYNLKITTDGG